MPRSHEKVPGERRGREARIRIAQEAARLMSEHGISDYGQATRRAAARLGIQDEAALPRRSEVEDALREFQRLFRGDTQPRVLRERREAAFEAMRFFAAFEPRLVGPVLDGTADEHSTVTLHLFSDDPHAVQDALERHRIPFEPGASTLRDARDRSTEHAAYAFVADGIAFELVVLASDALRHPPLGGDDRPVERASAATLAQLLRG